MRIVGGSLRGRRLTTPRDQSIRPTTDRNRESLFNILSHGWPEKLGGKVLDTFAGTGALGFEAISRGASHCLFIEKSAQAAAMIEQTIKAFNLLDAANLMRRDATRPGPVDANGPYDLVFADPPYGKGLGEKAAAGLIAGSWLNHNSIFVLEERSDAMPKDMDNFTLLDLRRHRDTSVGIFRFAAA